MARGARRPDAWIAATKADPPSRSQQRAAKAAVDEVAKIESIAQSQFVRDIVPLHRVALDAAWLAWNNGTVVRLAQAAYDNRILPGGTLDNDLLAILADALEEAGCPDMDILGHLRGPGPHVRGCWLVDLILSKEKKKGRDSMLRRKSTA
jgi:hypothetical protein